MEYRKFGELDFRVSALGFGCMRLPTLGKYDAIDEPLAIEMIRYAIDNGVNYLDSAHGYHGGNSERLIARALTGTPPPQRAADPPPRVIPSVVEEPSKGANRWHGAGSVAGADSPERCFDKLSMTGGGRALLSAAGRAEKQWAEATYRDKVRVATKMPAWAVKSPADFDRFFEESCERLQSPRIDFYLLHNIQAGFWANVRGHGVLAWLDKRLAEGRIGATGFSFHDSLPVLREVIAAYPHWTVCQLQYNFVCEEVQAGTEGVKYAADKGLAVVVMEPLFGGALAKPPASVRALWDAAGKDPADVALRWLWDKPEVATVLSGMSTLEQVRANVASAAASGVGKLSPEERELVARVREGYKELAAVPCTGCGYCVPCPNGVAIPENFMLLNQVRVHGGGVAGLNRNLYAQMPEEKRADACVACGKCEERCPQHIKIADWLARVHAAMTEQ